MYYAKGNNVYSCQTPLEDNAFCRISAEEYMRRMSTAVANREKGIRVKDEDEM